MVGTIMVIVPLEPRSPAMLSTRFGTLRKPDQRGAKSVRVKPQIVQKRCDGPGARLKPERGEEETNEIQAAEAAGQASEVATRFWGSK